MDFFTSVLDKIDLMALKQHSEYALRIILAAICGGVVGYERKNRLKEAGIRTHLIIALASALMMIVSKYGFYDIINGDSIRLDPSRIAASIITGVGFLGAGTIFVRKQVVSGLTTAAGMWATSGIGMALGAGMYFEGILSTVLVVVFQVFLHKNLRFLRLPDTELISIHTVNSPEATAAIQEIFFKKKVSSANFKAEKQEDGTLIIEAYIKLPSALNSIEILEILNTCPYILSVEI